MALAQDTAGSNALAPTFEQRVTQLIGTKYKALSTNIASGTANNLGSIFDESLRSVVILLPADYLVSEGRKAATSETGTSGTAVEGKYVIQVLREDADNVLRECKKVSTKEYSLAGDSESIYFATDRSPVYKIAYDASNYQEVMVLPDPSATDVVSVYTFDWDTNRSYQADALDITSSSNKGLYAQSIEGLPYEAEQVVIYKAALDYLQVYLGDTSNEEEDPEMFQLVTGQVQSLTQLFINEMKKLGVNLGA